MNMTEIEFSALSKQCLDRRTGDIEAHHNQGCRRELAVQQNHPELNKY